MQRRALVLFFLLCALCASCVAGREQRATTAEASQGAPPEPSEATAGSLVAGATKTVPDPDPGPAPTPGAVFVRGYWHWSGVRYVWTPGHWEQGRPPYAVLPSSP